MKNINDKEIEKAIYEGYKLLDTRAVTTEDILISLNSLSGDEKIIIFKNMKDIITKLQENNEIFVKALLKDILKDILNRY